MAIREWLCRWICRGVVFPLPGESRDAYEMRRRSADELLKQQIRDRLAILEARAAVKIRVEVDGGARITGIALEPDADAEER